MKKLKTYLIIVLILSIVLWVTYKGVHLYISLDNDSPITQFIEMVGGQ